MGRTLNGMSNRLSRLLFGLMSANWANYFVAKTIRWRFFGWLLQGWLREPMAAGHSASHSSNIKITTNLIFCLALFFSSSPAEEMVLQLSLQLRRSTLVIFQRGEEKLILHEQTYRAQVGAPTRYSGKDIRGHNSPKYDECHTRS